MLSRLKMLEETEVSLDQISETENETTEVNLKIQTLQITKKII